MDNDCNFPDFVQEFSHVGNDALIMNDAWIKQTDAIGQNVKNKVTTVNIVLWSNSLRLIKNPQICTKEAQTH